MENPLQAILQRLDNIELLLEKIQLKISKQRIQKNEEHNTKPENTQIESQKNCVTETKLEKLRKRILFLIQVLRFLIETTLFF